MARATAADPEFRLSADTVGPIVEICRGVDGLPLALELAAARVRSMGAAELADRLHGGFAVLSAGSRRAPRHRTLDATVRWSYELLGFAEQLLFLRLSVFATTFTIEDAEETCADDAVNRDAIANLIGALVDKSMATADTTLQPTRYSLLETLRAFGRERLDSATGLALRRRHLARAIREVEQARTELDGPDESGWGDRVEERFDDLRVAHRWALANRDVDAALRLVVGLREFAFRRMRYELFSWVDATLMLPDVDRHPLGAAAVASAAYGRFVRGDLDRAMTLAERSLEIERRDEVPPCGLHWRTMGNVAYYRGQADLAADFCSLMVDAARRDGTATRLVHALYMASVGLASAGQTEDSKRLADEALALAETTGNPTALASALYASGLAVEDAHPDLAAALLRRAVTHGDAGGNRWIGAFARTELVSLAGRSGDLDVALADASSVIDTWYRAGDWANQWLTLRQVAGVFARRGELHHAAVLHAAVRNALADTAMPIAADDSLRVAEMLGRLPSQLGSQGVDAAEREAAAMSANEVVHHTRHTIDRMLGPVGAAGR
ncbi:MAG: hypothetical protein CL424_13530 [Acidimicrobiaceae bacterium]|nr:hypothetical protein [Acidimicrobiaceae bacterium]